MTDELLDEAPEAEPEPAPTVPKRKSLEEMILEADPRWRPGKPYTHLQSITGPDGHIIRFVTSDGAPGNPL